MSRGDRPTPEREESMTPEEVMQRYYGPERKAGSLFSQLFTPKSRALILDVLVSERGEALTVSEIARMTDGIAKSSVHNHIHDLVDLDVVEAAGKKGNAQTYRMDTIHPVAQLLCMLDNIVMWGRTPPMLDEAFIFEGDSQEMLRELQNEDVFVGEQESAEE